MDFHSFFYSKSEFLAKSAPPAGLHNFLSREEVVNTRRLERSCAAWRFIHREHIHYIMGESASAALVAILMGGPPSPSQEKEAIDRFLLQHAQRYDFSSRAAGETFGEVFRLVVARFLLIVAPKGDKRDAAACREQPADLWPRDYLLRVLQCMRVLTRDPAHRSLFSDLGGTEVLVRLFVELSSEHCLHPHAEFASEMLVETLSILKRFASSSTLCPSPVGRCSLADGLHLQRALLF